MLLIRRYYLITVMLGFCFQAYGQQRESDGIDNVLEMMPYASVFTLKACGVKAKDDWAKLTATTVASWAVTAGTAYLLKHTIKETRPDGTNQHSFPSGHTSIAFAGATMLHKEFGKVSPWISVAGFGIATCVGVDRVLRDRHYWHDVVAGAGIGIVATEATWWLSRKVFKSKNDQVQISFGGNTLDVAIKF